MEDQEIVGLYWQRNEEAIRETERKYGRYCFEIAYHVLYEKESVKECLQDTWIAAWDSIPPHRPENLRTYLGKIVRNLAINTYEKMNAQKRRGAETELALDELSEVIGKPSDVEEYVKEEMLKDSINRFLRRCEKETRIFFIQRYWYMMSVEEIAKENKVTVSKVKMNLSRTRERLRDHLREEGYSC